jgi:hypothetical protein
VDERGSPWDSSRVEFESCVVVQLYLKVDLIFPHELFVRTLPVAARVQTCLLCVCVYTHALSLNTTQCQVLRPELSQYTWYSYHNAWLHFWSCGRLARQERPPNTESRSLVTIHSTVTCSSLRELVPAKLWSCPPNMANYFRAIRFGSDTKLIDHAVLVRSAPRISLILLLVVGSQPNRKELEAARERN